MLPLWAKVDQGAMAMKRCSAFPKLQHHWNLTIRLFGVISRILVEGYPYAKMQSVYSTTPHPNSLDLKQSCDIFLNMNTDLWIKWLSLSLYIYFLLVLNFIKHPSVILTSLDIIFPSLDNVSLEPKHYKIDFLLY